MKPRYFLSKDKKCVWKFQDGFMSFVDLNHKKPARLTSSLNIVTIDGGLKEISEKKAKKLNILFVK